MLNPEDDDCSRQKYGSFESVNSQEWKEREAKNESQSSGSLCSKQKSAYRLSRDRSNLVQKSIGYSLDGLDSDGTTDAAPPRTLGIFQLAGLMYLVTAGGGYGLEPVVQAAGPLPALIGLLVVPWIWSAPQALMTAELSTLYPRDGGFVLWVEEAFGNFWGFQVGWWNFFGSLVDNALLPRLFSDYLKIFLGVDHLSLWLSWGGGIFLLLFCFILNYRGLEIVGWASIIFVVIVAIPFAILTLVGLPQSDPKVWLQWRGHRDTNWSLFWATLLWNLCGFDSAGTCAGEVKNASRTYPAAILLSCALGLASFLLPVAASVTFAQDWDEWNDAFWPLVANRVVGGTWCGTLITLGGLASAAGMLNSLMATSSRALYGMATTQLLPPELAVLHRVYKTPVRCIALVAVGTALFSLLSFEKLVEIDSVLYCIKEMLEFSALVRLRYKYPHISRPFAIPGGFIGVWLCCCSGISCCVLMICLSGLAAFLSAMSMILIGFILYPLAHWWLAKHEQAQMKKSSSTASFDSSERI
ncbi:Probable polyamine transporter [Galdieria sulphuraria]|nr:Probable polyamine transporter [Galdieria sulphuraria]